MKKQDLVLRTVFIFVISLVLLAFVLPWTNLWKNYRLGLDLQWWIELDYKVDFEEVKKEEWENFTETREKEIIENLKKIIDKRIEALWINDSELNNTSYWDERHIIVQIPLKWANPEENKKNIDSAKKAIWNVVKVSFKEQRTQNLTEDDLKARKEIANLALNEINSWELFSVVKDKYKLNFEKVVSWSFFTDGKNNLSNDDLNSIRQIFSENNYLVWNKFYEDLNKLFDEKTNLTKEELSSEITNIVKNISEQKWQNSFTLEENQVYVEIMSVLSDRTALEIWKYFKENEKNLSADKVNEITTNSWLSWYLLFKKIDENTTDFIFIDWTPSEWINIVSSDWKTLNDKYLLKASVSTDQIWQSTIVLTFNEEWWKIFYEATSRLVWKSIAIFVGWKLVTAPNVNQAISWWQATITWRYTPRLAQASADNINAWLVPAPIYLTSEKTIDSKIGSAALDKLITAWAYGFLLMFLFLVIVYRASWVAAFLALVIYTIIVLSIVKYLWMVLTLASIAWLILSVWMAIDANILIFERIKWELRAWKNMKEALEEWFASSWSAIWDSNITWLLVAIILFIFGINMIKWFWAMLAIWIVVSLFTAMYVSRIFVALLAEKIKDKKLFIWMKK